MNRKNRKDMIGKKYLTFTITDVFEPKEHSHQKFIVKCDCGLDIEIGCVKFEHAIWQKKTFCPRCIGLKEFNEKRVTLKKSIDEMNKRLDKIEREIIRLREPSTIFF